jgi:hypothetical protein
MRKKGSSMTGHLPSLQEESHYLTTRVIDEQSQLAGSSSEPQMLKPIRQTLMMEAYLSNPRNSQKSPELVQKLKRQQSVQMELVSK